MREALRERQDDSSEEPMPKKRKVQLSIFRECPKGPHSTHSITDLQILASLDALYRTPIIS